MLGQSRVLKGSQVVVVLHRNCCGPFSYQYRREHRTFWKTLVYWVCVVYRAGLIHAV